MRTQTAKEIWILDDDIDDHKLLQEIFEEMKWDHPLVLFSKPADMLKKLETADGAPFIIISEVNLPKMDGFALREKMLNAPSNKFHSVPFIFWSTQASEAQIRQAYRLQAHGFFLKQPQFEDWKRSLVRIIDYWTSCLQPSKEDKPDPPLV